MKLEHVTNNLLKSYLRTPLHWACKRNYEDLVKVLLEHGANPELKNCMGERPGNLCTTSTILELLGENTSTIPKENLHNIESNLKFVPNYIKYPPLNGEVDIRSRLHSKHPDFSSLPTTFLPSQTHSTYISNIAKIVTYSSIMFSFGSQNTCCRMQWSRLHRNWSAPLETYVRRPIEARLPGIKRCWKSSGKNSQVAEYQVKKWFRCETSIGNAVTRDRPQDTFRHGKTQQQLQKHLNRQGSNDIILEEYVCVSRIIVSLFYSNYCYISSS